jgi:hypothetical protein
MKMVTVPRPNFYLSSEGFSVEVLGRTGLCYCDHGRQMFVDSEILMPPAGILIYRDSIVGWQSPDSGVAIDDVQREKIVRNIVDVLGSQGIEVQVI